MSASERNEWRSAVDPKSERTYYFNTKTKETTWTKPLAMATPEERDEMIRLDREKREFFREMEANMKKKWAAAQQAQEKFLLSGSPVLNYMSENEYHALFAGMDNTRRRLSSVNIGSIPRRIRTISTIDDDILTSMKNQEAKKSSMFPVIDIPGATRMNAAAPAADAKLVDNSPIEPGRRLRTGSMDRPDEMPLPLCIDAKDSEANAVPLSPRSHNAQQKQKLIRRNSTGTLYISNTMSQQDDDNTIHCVCVVIRAHMLDAVKEAVAPHPEFEVFKDLHSTPRNGKRNLSTSVPSLTEVKDFFNAIYKKSQLESDCIIMALIYCERLVKETKGRLSIRLDNWKSILFACLVMASKVWDDLSMWNVDFSQVVTGFDLQRVNDLELAMLNALKYVIRVSASEYAKYYFHLRSMSARLDLTNSSESIAPLDMAGARKLQIASEHYQLNAIGGALMGGADGEGSGQGTSSSLPINRRYSVDNSAPALAVHAAAGAADRSGLHRQSSDNSTPEHHTPKTVALEQLLHSDHSYASGVSTSKSGKLQQPNLLKSVSLVAEEKLSSSNTARVDAKMAKK